MVEAIGMLIRLLYQTELSFAIKTSTQKSTIRLQTVEPSSSELFLYPFIHMTGHGNVVLVQMKSKIWEITWWQEVFHIDDNYGMDEFVRKEIKKKLIPDNSLKNSKITSSHFPRTFYAFNVAPKIHEHDNKQPQAFAFFIEGRLAHCIPMNVI